LGCAPAIGEDPGRSDAAISPVVGLGGLEVMGTREMAYPTHDCEDGAGRVHVDRPPRSATRTALNELLWIHLPSLRGAYPRCSTVVRRDNLWLRPCLQWAPVQERRGNLT